MTTIPVGPGSRPVVIILASGRGERFFASGGACHKLDALLHGRTVLQHTIAAVTESGLACHVEQANHPGMGDAIAAAVRNTAQADGWLILPGDLPLVRGRTIRQVADALSTVSNASCDVIMPKYQELAGHPVAFSRRCFNELSTLYGDAGAAAVVKARREQGLVQYLEVDDIGVRFDIDTCADLERAEHFFTVPRHD